MANRSRPTPEFQLALAGNRTQPEIAANLHAELKRLRHGNAALKQQRNIQKSGRLLHERRKSMRFAFIEAERILPVIEQDETPSGYRTPIQGVLIKQKQVRHRCTRIRAWSVQGIRS